MTAEVLDNPLLHNNDFDPLRKRLLQALWEEKNALYQNFFVFKIFSTMLKKKFNVMSNICYLQMLSSRTWLKFYHLVKG